MMMIRSREAGAVIRRRRRIALKQDSTTTSNDQTALEQKATTDYASMVILPPGELMTERKKSDSSVAVLDKENIGPPMMQTPKRITYEPPSKKVKMLNSSLNDSLVAPSTPARAPSANYSTPLRIISRAQVTRRRNRGNAVPAAAPAMPISSSSATPLRSGFSMAGANLLATPKQGARSALKQFGLRVVDDEIPKHGKHASVYAAKVIMSPSPHTPGNQITEAIFATPKKRLKFQSPNVMIKVQANTKYKDKNNICIREMNINSALNAALGNQCPNFIRMYAVRNTNSGIVEETEEEDDEPVRARNNKRKRDESDEHVPHFIYVMEKADETLRDFVSRMTKNESGVTPNFIRSCLFQLFYVLHMAQTTCEFQHNDLHFKNVLLKKLKNTSNTCAFHLNGKTFVSTEEYLVKLADFGLSRVKLPNGSIVYNERIGDMFSDTVDIQSVHTQLKSVKVKWDVVENKDERTAQQSLFSKLKREMSKGLSGPGQLLKHEFFNPMIVSDCDSLSGGVLHFGDKHSSNEKENFRESISSQIGSAMVLSPNRKRFRFRQQ